MRRVCLAAVLALAAVAGFALAGCGGSTSAPPDPSTFATATGPPTETSNSTTTLSVYFLRRGKVATARRSVPATRAVGRAALDALVEGPTADEREAELSTRVPAETSFDLRIAEGVASVTSSGPLTRQAQAQVVYTLTQFPTVRAVDLGQGERTRAAFEIDTPAILIESPVVGETLSDPVRIRGTANTFEATFIVELLLNAAGQRAFQEVVTATSGSGTRGTFDILVPLDVRGPGTGTLVAYEESAKDGSQINRVEIPVLIGG